MRTYIVTLSAMSANIIGTYDAERIEEVYEYLSGEYPNYTVHSIIEVPTLKL